MRKKILYNVLTSFLSEIVVVICAFILPRMIIAGYGSEYNGIVSSVTQFLSVVTLLRGGVGGVTRAALYKPLVENDSEKISAILNATEIFMRKIANIFIVFLVVFAVFYPLIVSKQFGWFYTFSLVLILGISTIAQYYFGITYQFLLIADQRAYIYTVLQTIATILNTVFSVILINIGIEFRLMKLVSAIVFAAIPIVLYWYCHKRYNISSKITPNFSTLKQRWDAFIHQLSAYIYSSTDVILLTLFTDLYTVSVYSIYYMIVDGIRKFAMTLLSGMEALFGELLAKNEYNDLHKTFNFYEMIISIVSVILFSVTLILIVPFVKIYTVGITDTNYIVPFFAVLIVISTALYCLRIPYYSIIMAAGHFKETKAAVCGEAVLNLVLSVVLIAEHGIVGVAAGTVVSTIFGAVYYVLYLSKNIFNRKISLFLKRFIINALDFIFIVIVGNFVVSRISIENYIVWAACGFVSVTFAAIVVFGTNALFYRKEFFDSLKKLVKRA